MVKSGNNVAGFSNLFCHCLFRLRFLYLNKCLISLKSSIALLIWFFSLMDGILYNFQPKKYRAEKIVELLEERINYLVKSFSNSIIYHVKILLNLKV